jgi:CRISPR-associated protein (TIGR03985 family)
LRFPATFARWYVDNTVRHPTFRSIAYSRLPDLVRQEIPDPLEQQEVLKLIDRRSANDAYSAVWIRAGDINVTMRLRDWRPNGEVIAPLSLRQDIAKEVTQELAHYSD